MLELVVVLGLTPVLISIVYTFFSTVNRAYYSESSKIETNGDARSTIVFMSTELRNAIYIDPAQTTSDQIRFWRCSKDGDRGFSTGGNSSTTLNDSNKAWTNNQFAATFIAITAGTGEGQMRYVTGNTATQLTITPAWPTVPDDTSVYNLDVSISEFYLHTDDKVYYRLSDGDGELHHEALLEDVTVLQFTLDPALPVTNEVQILMTYRDCAEDANHTVDLQNGIYLRNLDS